MLIISPVVLSISIHTPHAGSDGKIPDDAVKNESISIHTPHAGSDNLVTGEPGNLKISIHTPHAGSDFGLSVSDIRLIYFNPHSPCGERHHRKEHFYRNRAISIHTPHAGSDCDEKSRGFCNQISIHTPHAGSDIINDLQNHTEYDFNPHSPCGERLNGDACILLEYEFQSTLPMRGATGIL